MSAVKRINNGDYSIYTTDAVNAAIKTGNVVVVTNTFKVAGNIELSGTLNTVNLTVLNSTTEINDLHVFDNNITLNAGANIQYSGNSGITINRVTDGNAALVWDESIDQWRITSNTSNSSLWHTIASFPTGSLHDTLYYENVGGNIQVQNTSRLQFNNTNATLSLAFSNVSSTNLPGLVANTVTIAANAANGTTGGTGIYFNSNGVQDELISRRKALVYSIIF